MDEYSSYSQVIYAYGLAMVGTNIPYLKLFVHQRIFSNLRSRIIHLSEGKAMDMTHMPFAHIRWMVEGLECLQQLSYVI